MSAFNQYFVGTIKNRYANFEGRARRSEYWYFTLFYVLSYLLISFCAGLLTALLGESLAFISIILIAILVFGLLIPNLAVTIRRLHDIGKSGWFMLIGIIPLVGSIILLVYLCSEGQPGTNLYGPDPKALPAANASDHLLDDLD